MRIIPKVLVTLLLTGVALCQTTNTFCPTNASCNWTGLQTFGNIVINGTCSGSGCASGAVTWPTDTYSGIPYYSYPNSWGPTIAPSGTKCYPFMGTGGTGCDTPTGGTGTVTHTAGALTLSNVSFQNPYMVWSDPSVGKTNLRCSYVVGSMQFSAHYPSSGYPTVGGGASSVTVGANTPAFTASVNWLDGLTSNGQASGLYGAVEGGTFSSSNTGILTVNPTTGVAHGVATGSAQVSFSLFGVTSPSPQTVTVNSGSGTYYFPSH